MAPRVLLDATAIPPARGGIGRYLEGLVGGLAHVGGVDLSIVCKRQDADGFSELAPRARIVPGPLLLDRRPARLAWEQTALPNIVRRVGADVLHSPHYTMPLMVDRPIVVTVHDLTFFSHPGTHLATKQVFFRRAIRTAARRATRLIVPSRATKDELLRVLHAEPAGIGLPAVDPARIDIAHLGVEPAVFHRPSPDEVTRVSRELGVSVPYIAFLGTQTPLKNTAALVRAWSHVVHEKKHNPALVLAGSAGWDDQVAAAAAEVQPPASLLRPGYLPIKYLAGFLGGAEIVAYPSLGEGFGIPVLEAMACGSAVLTTRRLSLPEVGGDAVAYTEPDVASIATALRELLDDPERRSDLGSRGVERASHFTWEASAAAHVTTYERAFTEVRAA